MLVVVSVAVVVSTVVVGIIVVVDNSDFVAIVIVVAVVTVVGIFVFLASKELDFSESFAVTLVTLVITYKKSFEDVVAVIVGKSTIDEVLPSGEEFFVVVSLIDLLREVICS